MAKLNWRLYSDKEALWTKILRAKYSTETKISSRHFHTWRSIRKGRELFNEGSCKLVKTGSHTSFWFDNWLGVGSIRSHIQGPITHRELGLKVNDCWVDHHWNFDYLSTTLPNHIKSKIESTTLLWHAHAEDTFTWTSSHDGIFTNKSAYLLALKPSSTPISLVGNGFCTRPPPPGPTLPLACFACQTSHQIFPSHLKDYSRQPLSPLSIPS
ncbi:hypothetical protein ACSBR2_003623 [Camellia fascicularis]